MNKKIECSSVDNFNILSSYVFKNNNYHRIIISFSNLSVKTRKDKKMNNCQLEEIKPYLEDYIQRNGVDTTKKMFRCLICGSSDACHIVPNTDGKLWKCFSANHSKYSKNTGDIFEYAMQLNNTDFPKACKILQDIYLDGHTIEPFKTKPQEKPMDIQMEDFISKQIPFDISRAIEHANENRQYLLNRGISVETQKHYNVGFINEYVHPKQIYEYNIGIRKNLYPTQRIIIPTSKESYLARAVNPQDEGKNGKYKVLKAGNTHIFNADILKENVGYCFCFEGEIDALSGIECGVNSIGLGSISMIDKLFKEYQINPENVLIIAMDNDEGGKNSVSKFETSAKENKIPYIVADSNFLFNGVKDCNQALQENKQVLIERLKKAQNEALNFNKVEYQEDLKKAYTVAQSVIDGTLHPWHDIGRIDRAKSLIGDTLKYCKFSNMWYKYNETLGVLSKNQTDTFIDDLQRNLLVHMQQEYAIYTQKDEENGTSNAKEFKKEMKSAIGEKAFQNTLKGLQRQHNIAIELQNLDKPNLLNFKDVALNLDTLQTMPHSIDNLCTKYVDTNFYDTLDPRAVQNWNNFISEIMCQDEELIEFLQRLCGYILEITNKEEFLTIFYGPTTRNGKSTLLYAIQNLFLDYSKAVSSSTLAETKTTDGPKPEIIDLIGAKLITCGELNSETLLNDTLLKSLLGRDLIKARGMCSDNMLQIYIDGKIFANCNELPPMKNDDLLNSMRVLVVPFNRHFEENEQKKDLKQLFKTPKYKAVIWDWIFTGYKRYKEHGIKAKLPKAVKQSIKEYQSEANSINVFLNDNEIFERIDCSNYEECIKLDKASINHLYPRYVEMCRDNNQNPLAKPNFTKQLRKNKSYKRLGEHLGKRYLHCLCGYKYIPRLTLTDAYGSTHVIQN